MGASARDPFAPGDLSRQDRPSLHHRGPVLAKPVAVARPGHLPTLAVLLLSALLLRASFLGSPSLWLDEIWSIAAARLSWPKLIWLILHQDSNASLYYVLLHFWVQLGSSEAVVRSLSVLLGVISIPVLYRLGYELYGRPVGLVASSFLIVSKLHVEQSQDARGYSLVVLLVLLSSLSFVRCIEKPSAKSWFAYAIFSGLALYAHVFALLVPVSHAASLLFLRRRQVDWRGVFASAGGILAFLVPLGLLLHAREHSAGAPLSWVPPLTFGMVVRIFWSMAGGSHFGITGALVAGVALCFGYAALLLLFARWCVRQCRQHGRSLESWRASFVLLWFALPIVSTILLSLKAPLLIDKYLIISLPALVIAAAKGTQLLRPGWSQAAVVSIVALGLIGLLPYFYVRAHDQEWQGITRTIMSEAQPGDAVLFMVAPGRLLYHYYGGGAQGHGPHVLYPEFNNGFMNDPASLLYMPPLQQDSLHQWARQYPRIWVVLYHDEFWDTHPVAEQIQNVFSAGHAKRMDTTFDGSPFFERAELLLYAKPAGASQTITPPLSSAAAVAQPAPESVAVQE